MRTSFLRAASGLLYAASLVSAHCKISNAVGDQGGKAVGFGISANPKDSNSQGDVTQFNKGKFGATNDGGNIDPDKDIVTVQQIAGNTLPQLSDGGQLTMTLHQVNGDGAGPMACFIDTAATGNFKAITVDKDVPGNNGNSGAADTDFPLIVSIDAGTACTGTVGGVNNVCLVKCQNPAGPFGSIVPIQIASGGGGGGGGGGNGNGGKGNGKGQKKNNNKGRRALRERLMAARAA